MSLLSVKNVHVSVLDETIIDAPDGFNIAPGDVVLLSGKNGSGKSTLIRMIMDDLTGGSVSANADIIHHTIGDVFSSARVRQQFNQHVCYVPQNDDFEAERLIDCCLTSLAHISCIDEKEKYIFDFVKKYSFYTVCFTRRESVALKWRDQYARKLLAKCGIDPMKADQEDIKTALYLSSNPARMSGGQKKIANILSALVRCEYSDLLIIDEPLNALDYDNVRLFSNILNRIHRNYPKTGMLIVTHCRALASLNRIITIENKTITEAHDRIACNSCFGSIDENGFYL